MMTKLTSYVITASKNALEEQVVSANMLNGSPLILEYLKLLVKSSNLM